MHLLQTRSSSWKPDVLSAVVNRDHHLRLRQRGNLAQLHLQRILVLRFLGVVRTQFVENPLRRLLYVLHFLLKALFAFDVSGCLWHMIDFFIEKRLGRRLYAVPPPPPPAS